MMPARGPLGALFGQHREALVRVRINDSTVTTSRALASVRLQFRDPDDGNLPRIQEVIARTGFSADATAVPRPKTRRRNRSSQCSTLRSSSSARRKARDKVTSVKPTSSSHKRQRRSKSAPRTRRTPSKKRASLRSRRKSQARARKCKPRRARRPRRNETSRWSSTPTGCTRPGFEFFVAPPDACSAHARPCSQSLRAALRVSLRVRRPPLGVAPRRRGGGVSVSASLKTLSSVGAR